MVGVGRIVTWVRIFSAGCKGHTSSEKKIQAQYRVTIPPIRSALGVHGGPCLALAGEGSVSFWSVITASY